MPTLNINQQALQVFEGATVGDAVRSYLALHHSTSDLDEIEVRDQWGHRVDMEGAITEGAAFNIRLKTSATAPPKV